MNDRRRRRLNVLKQSGGASCLDESAATVMQFSKLLEAARPFPSFQLSRESLNRPDRWSEGNDLRHERL
jgi:hypothetical protein